jgi:hypothetical protein
MPSLITFRCYRVSHASNARDAAARQARNLL